MSACCARPPPRACRVRVGIAASRVLTSHLHGASPSCTRRHHGDACRTERSAGPPPRGGPTSGSKRTHRCRHPGLASRPSRPPPSRSSSPAPRPFPPILATARTSPATGWAWASMGGPGWDDMGGLGRGGLMRGPMGGMFDEAMDGFVRHETIYQTEDGTVTRRTDMGTVASTGETSLEYTLATGETASVTTDDATEIVVRRHGDRRAGQQRPHARAAGCQRRSRWPTSRPTPTSSSGPSPRRTARSWPSASSCARLLTPPPMTPRSTGPRTTHRRCRRGRDHRGPGLPGAR